MTLETTRGRPGPDRPGVFGVDGDAVVVDRSRHLAIVGSPAPDGFAEQAGDGRVAGDNTPRHHRLPRPRFHLQVLGQLVGDVVFPIDIIGVGQDRPEARRVDLVPAQEGTVPGPVEAVEGPVFHLEPIAEPRLGRVAVAELEKLLVPEMINLRPVDDVGLAPEVPSQKRRAILDDLGRLGEEPEDLFPDLEVVETKPGGRLGLDGQAVRGDELGVRIFPPYPVGSRVDIDLDDDSKADLPGPVDDGAQGAEIVPVLLRLAVRSLDPRADGVEAQTFDLFQVLFPQAGRFGRHFFEHRSPGLPSGIPDRDREELILSLGRKNRTEKDGQKDRQKRRSLWQAFIPEYAHLEFSSFRLAKESPAALSLSRL